MSNPFGCPDNVYETMRGEHEPAPYLLWCISRLGPKRVQWIDKCVGPVQRNPVCWTLDGKPATYREIIDAAETAGLNPKAPAAGVRGQTRMVRDVLRPRPPLSDPHLQRIRDGGRP